MGYASQISEGNEKEQPCIIMTKFIGHYNVKDPDVEERLGKIGFQVLYADEKISFYHKESEAAHGPFFISEDNSNLIFWGNILNIDNLHKEGNNIADQASCLSELLKLYRRNGDKIIDQLDGSFALALWDKANKKLHLCRDDGGTKLLYYCRYKEDGLLFSNDLGVLLRTSDKIKISKKALFEYLRFLDISPPYTIYENVWFLEPEKIASIDSTGIDVRRKEIKNQVVLENIRATSHYADIFEMLFRESVNKRLMLNPNVGVFLSGGIDSSLVCAIAADLQNDLIAVTVGFDDPKFDESRVARKITNYLGIDHEIMVFSKDQDFDAFHDFTTSIASPFADPAIIPTFQCFKHIGAKIDLMLDGTGADTLIGIMPPRHLRFILNYSRHIPLMMRSNISKILEYSRLLFRYSDLFSFEDAAELLIRWKGWTRKEISFLCEEACDLSHTMFYRIYYDHPKKSPYELYSMLMGALPDDRIHQSSSIFGPEVAFPFFDREIQSYVRKLPFKYKYNQGYSKLLFRNLLGKYIPQNIWDVPKHGFNYPLEELLKYRDFELIKIYLSQHALKKHGMFDTSVVHDCVSRFFRGDESVKFKIWALVIFQGWYQNYYEKL